MKRQKRCAVCGKKITPPRLKYCSDKCYVKATNAKAKIKHCAVCGAEFKARANQRYCSPECVREARCKSLRESLRRYRARRKAEQGPIIRKCGYCGKEFEIKSGNHRYCSPECQKKAKNKLQREHHYKERARLGQKCVRLGEKRTCAICGAEFAVRTANNKYCSPQCAAEAQRIQKHEHYERNKGKRTVKKAPKTDPAAQCSAAGLNCFECPYEDCQYD